MAYSSEIFTSSIVAVGDFNPVIFTPDWLERNNLIGEGDAIDAREGSQGRPLLISHQVTTFECEWFVLQVLENQFSLTSKGPLSPALKDLATGIFQLVSQTPVKAVGLNFIEHFKFSDSAEYHKVGDILAPKDIWSTLYTDVSVGMEQMVIVFQDGIRDGTPESKNQKRITVQPSSQFKYGISLLLNDHHDVDNKDDELLPAERLTRIIDEQWELTLIEAQEVFKKVLTTVIEK